MQEPATHLHLNVLQGNESGACASHDDVGCRSDYTADQHFGDYVL
jgi:hypothetical protein